MLQSRESRGARQTPSSAPLEGAVIEFRNRRRWEQAPRAQAMLSEAIPDSSSEPRYVSVGNSAIGSRIFLSREQVESVAELSRAVFPRRATEHPRKRAGPEFLPVMAQFPEGDPPVHKMGMGTKGIPLARDASTCCYSQSKQDNSRNCSTVRVEWNHYNGHM